MNKTTRIFSLTRFELALWLTSAAVTLASYIFIPGSSVLNLIASLIGVTGLIFIAKGAVIGQLLTVIFAVFYGVISFHFRYYGEMITYLCMSAPIAIMAMIAWFRHPFQETKEVAVAAVSRRALVILALSAVAVTAVFGWILWALDTANLVFSTLSVTTSYVAAALTFLRSPWYGLGYSANDVVLIVLWVLAAIENPQYWVMVACFVMFLANDMYGFFNWRRMQRRQAVAAA